MKKIIIWKVSGLFWTPQKEHFGDCLCSQNFRHKKAAEKFMESLPTGGINEAGEYRKWAPKLYSFRVPKNLKNRSNEWDWY